MSNSSAAEKLLHNKRKSYPFPSSLSPAAEKPPHKKSKTSPSSWSLLSSLPDDMALYCLARASRSDKAALSMVSKSYQSLMSSPELEKTRSLMGFTENSLYVCLLTHPDPIPRWFILRRTTVNRLIRIPSSPSQPTEGSSVVALDWGIYVIGGSSKGKPRSSNVLLLDCRTHTWTQAPSMGVARSSAVAGVVDGKIYVFGGCKDPDCSNWAEVFDPKTQTWDAFTPMPDPIRQLQYILTSAVVMEDKLYAVDALARTFYYSPSQGQWGRVTMLPRGDPFNLDWCCIDGLIYGSGPSGDLYWCQPDQLECELDKGKRWRKVQGLDSLNKILSTSRARHFSTTYKALWDFFKPRHCDDIDLSDLLSGTRLTNFGGNIMLFWDVVIVGNRLQIWCAEISLERRQGPEIWGNSVWSNAVMTVDPFSHRYELIDQMKEE